MRSKNSHPVLSIDIRVPWYFVVFFFHDVWIELKKKWGSVLYWQYIVIWFTVMLFFFSKSCAEILGFSAVCTTRERVFVWNRVSDFNHAEKESSQPLHALLQQWGLQSICLDVCLPFFLLIHLYKINSNSCLVLPKQYFI